MKILLASSEIVSRARFDGGLANFVHRFSHALCDAGHEVTVVGPGDPDETADGADHRSGRPVVHRVPVSATALDRWLVTLSARQLHTLVSLRRLGITLAARIRRILAVEPHDVIQYSHLGGIGLFRPPGVPAVVRLSSSTTLYRQRGGHDLQNDFAMWQQQWLERRALVRADAIFGPGRLVAEQVAAEIGRPVEVIESPFFVETTEFDHGLRRTRLGDRDYLLFVGRFNAMKGITVIADILEPLLERYPDLLFAFAGREHAGIHGRSAAEHLVASAGPHGERVVVLGEVPHCSLYPIMADASAVVLPSLVDNFPNTALEAMAHRRVVIGTRGTSFEQLITDGDSGLLCPPGDADALLATIHRALSMPPDDAARMGERAAAAVTRFGPDRLLPLFTELYERVIRDHRRSPASGR